MSDLTLYIETTPRFSEVALRGPGRERILKTEQATGNRDLVALIRRLFEEEGAAPTDLAAVVIDVGPGALTSVRVGVAFGNALAYGRSIPTRGYSSLDIIGFAASAQTGVPTVVAVRGPEGAAYVGLWCPENGGRHWVLDAGDLAAGHEVTRALQSGAKLAGPAAETLAVWCPDAQVIAGFEASSAQRLIAIDESDRFRASPVAAQAPIVGENFR